LFKVTGIKFDKPFVAEVLEGSPIISSLLKKYPINESQVLYIFTDYGKNERYKATRVYHDGKIYTDRYYTPNENYFGSSQISTYYTLKEYNQCRQQAIKTLVLITDEENVVKVNNRESAIEEERRLLSDIYRHYDSTDCKIYRVKVEKEDNSCYITLKHGRGEKYEYQTSNRLEPIDKSGYCVEAFRKSLAKKINNYKNYQKLKEVVKTDYSQELQARYDEIIVLKNLVGTSVINNTDRETLDTLYDLMDTVISVLSSYDKIVRELKEAKKNCKEYKNKPFSFQTYNCYYKAVDDVTEDFEDLDQSILELRTDLFNEVLQ
jgi:hypothetical protein